jgi:hypothetical protein
MKKKEPKRKGRIVIGDEYFDNLNDSQNEGLLTAAMEIATRRAEAQREIRDLLLANEDEKALKLMRKFFGI